MLNLKFKFELTQLWNQRVSTKTLLNSRSSIMFQVVSAYSDQTTIPTCTHFVGFCFLGWEFSRSVCFKVSKISEGILDILQAKVKTLWKGHKTGKNLPLVLIKQLFLLSSVKTCGRFFQIFLAFSEKLNFKKKLKELLWHRKFCSF